MGVSVNAIAFTIYTLSQRAIHTSDYLKEIIWTLLFWSKIRAVGDHTNIVISYSEWDYTLSWSSKKVQNCRVIPLCPAWLFSLMQREDNLNIYPPKKPHHYTNKTNEIVMEFVRDWHWQRAYKSHYFSIYLRFMSNSSLLHILSI